MPLAGTFDVLDFGEVLGLLARRAATGRLAVRTMSMHGTIWLAEGKACAAEVVSQTGGDAKAKWQTQIEDICFDALRSLKGSFEFHLDEDGGSAVRTGTPLDLDEVVEAGRHRLDMWHDVESVIHSFEAVPRMAEAIDESVELDQSGWRILVALDGRHNVASLAKRLGLDLLEFCQQLKPLVQGGAVVLEQPDGWLKSLPKVRLEVAARDGEVFIDSTVVAEAADPSAPARASNPAEVYPAPGSAAAARDSDLPPPSSSAPPPAPPDGDTPRRRLRGRSKGRTESRLAG